MKHKSEKSRAKSSEWLTTKEIADQLGVVPKTVRNWIRHGVTLPNGRASLRAARVEFLIKVRKEWLQEFLEAGEASLHDVPPPPAIESLRKQTKRLEREQQAALKRLNGY